mgnify:CR=1 FL=1
MSNKVDFLNWLLLLVCAFAAIAGLVQLSYLLGFSLYSNDFNLNSITIFQVCIISLGIWGASEFLRTTKKIKLASK